MSADGWALIPEGQMVQLHDGEMVLPARIADALLEGQQRQAVIAEARTWLRTPWVHRARIKGAGVDCGQLLIAVYSAAGVIEPFDTGEYPQDFMLHQAEERFLGFVLRHAHEVDAPGPGDIAVWRHGRCFSHAGIVVQWPEVIHASVPEGQVAYGTAGRDPKLAGPVRFFSPWGEP